MGGAEWLPLVELLKERELQPEALEEWEGFALGDGGGVDTPLVLEEEVGQCEIDSVAELEAQIEGLLLLVGAVLLLSFADKKAETVAPLTEAKGEIDKELVGNGDCVAFTVPAVVREGAAEVVEDCDRQVLELPVKETVGEEQKEADDSPEIVSMGEEDPAALGDPADAVVLALLSDETYIEGVFARLADGAADDTTVYEKMEVVVGDCSSVMEGTAEPPPVRVKVGMAEGCVEAVK